MNLIIELRSQHKSSAKIDILVFATLQNKKIKRINKNTI